MNRSRSPRRTRHGFLKYLAIGCLAVIAIGVFGLFMAFKNFHKIAAAGVESGFTAMIETSPMPEAQKKELIKQVKSLAQDIRDKKIGIEEFTRIMEEFAEGPLPQIGIIAAARTQYFDGFTGTAEERADAELAFARLARGVLEEKIKRDQVERVTNLVLNQKPGGQGELKKLNDADRQELLATIKEIVDAAVIPNEAFEVDFAREFRRLIDRALGREVLEASEDYDGGTTPTMNLDRPENAGKESLDLDTPKEFPADTPAE